MIHDPAPLPRVTADRAVERAFSCVEQGPGNERATGGRGGGQGCCRDLSVVSEIPGGAAREEERRSRLARRPEAGVCCVLFIGPVLARDCSRCRLSTRLRALLAACNSLALCSQSLLLPTEKMRPVASLVLGLFHERARLHAAMC
jgi:hypothetical protein